YTTINAVTTFHVRTPRAAFPKEGRGTLAGSLWTVSVMNSIRCERQQSGDARPLDGVLQLALVKSAGPGDPARQNLSALGDELLQRLHVLVVDVLQLFDAEF